MKVLYILKKEPSEKIKNMIETHKLTANVSLIDMRENKNYSEIVDQVFATDKLISW